MASKGLEDLPAEWWKWIMKDIHDILHDEFIHPQRLKAGETSCQIPNHDYLNLSVFEMMYSVSSLREGLHRGQPWKRGSTEREKPLALTEESQKDPPEEACQRITPLLRYTGVESYEY